MSKMATAMLATHALQGHMKLQRTVLVEILSICGTNYIQIALPITVLSVTAQHAMSVLLATFCMVMMVTAIPMTAVPLKPILPQLTVLVRL